MELTKKPHHVAIIMDGNGRWAEKKRKLHLEGHRQGAESVKAVIRAAGEAGIEYLTLYAFSTENWSRSKEEVNGLMELLEEFIDDNIETVIEKGIKLKIIGRIEKFPESLVKKLQIAMQKTAKNSKGTLILALNYGGRAEICDAAKNIAREAVAGNLNPEQIDETLFSRYLYEPEIPDPDLMIRTSGESRLSNFLLWQLSYSELYITPTLWPDFGRDEFFEALSEFNNRKRRYGGRK